MANYKIDKKYLYWGITAFLVIAACIAFYSVIQHWPGIKAAIGVMLKILSPFILGAGLAYVLTPLVRLFQSKLFDPVGMKLFRRNDKKAFKFGRGMAVGIAVILIVTMASVLIGLIIPQIIVSVESIIKILPSNIENIQKWANQALIDYPELETHFSDVLKDINGTLIQWSRDTLLPQMSSVITSITAGVFSLLKTLTNMLIAVAVSIYMMYSREKLIAQAKKAMHAIFSVNVAGKVLNVLRFTDKTFLSFFIGKLLDSLIIGAICYVACLFIGIKDAVLIAFIIGITNIIPVFGPFIGAIPSALIILIYSPIKCLIFIIFIIVLQQFDGNFLGPKILGSKTGLSGLWVLFSIIVGAGLFGPIGMILGVPVCAVIMAGVRYMINSRLKNRGLPVNTNIYSDLDHIDPSTNEPITKEKTQ